MRNASSAPASFCAMSHMLSTRISNSPLRLGPRKIPASTPIWPRGGLPGANACSNLASDAESFPPSSSQCRPRRGSIPELVGRRDLGWILHDIDFAQNATPHFFHAQLVDAVLAVPPLPFGARGFGSQE